MQELGKLYLESHITLEPVFNEDLDTVKEIVHTYGFKVADLLMQKRLEDKPERSKFDTFCTSRGKEWDKIHSNTIQCVDELLLRGFKVWRYKIEDTLLDIRLSEQ